MDKSPPGSRFGLPSSSTPGIPMRFSAIPRRREASFLESVRSFEVEEGGAALLLLVVLLLAAVAPLSPFAAAAAASLVEEVDV